LWHGDERVSVGLMPFIPTKHLALADPELTTTVTARDGDFEIAISARKAARFVWLELEGTDAIFSDNYFDLPAGRTVTVKLLATKGWTAKHVREMLHVRSLAGSF
jgi:beta-mannosidase